MDRCLPNWSVSANRWILRQPPRPDATLRLFCFPHAGGSAWVFRRWSSWMPAEVEVCAIQLPGHGNRIREPAFAEFEPLVENMAASLQTEMQRPFVFFGHSLGALLAFELARRVRDRIGAEPLCLVVSGHNAPHLPEELDDVSNLDDAALIEQLRQLRCTPEQVLQNRELMKLMLPVIRADFAVCQSYVYRETQPLHCPLTVFGGIQDPRTDRAGLEGWRRHTQGPFRLRFFSGDHFFLVAEEQAVAGAVAEQILSVFGS